MAVSIFVAPAAAWATIGWSCSTRTTDVRTMIAVMIRNAPAVTVSAARPRPQPRRSNAPTIGANVAARTTARTTGITTNGSMTASQIANARRAAPMSRRQLHWATRSSQPGTIPILATEFSSGSRIATTEPHTAVTNATTGIATNKPTTPATAAPAGRAMSTTAGWMWTVLP